MTWLPTLTDVTPTPDAEYLRIGRPPTAPPQTGTNTARNVLAALLGISLILLGLAGYAAYRLAKQQPAASSTETAASQQECDSITRTYLQRGNHVGKLPSFPAADAAATKTVLDGLADDVIAMEAATRGHKDAPAKDLYIALLEYKWELALVSLEFQLANGSVKPEQRAKAVAAAAAMDGAYRAFAQQTCGEK